MLIDNGDGTCLVGRADVICILQLPDGRFHVAFFEERPMPGPVESLDKLSTIRLKSRLHHTAGATTIEEAREHAASMRDRIVIDDSNVFLDAPLVLDDPISTLVVPNWLRGTMTLGEALLSSVDLRGHPFYGYQFGASHVAAERIIKGQQDR